MFPAQEPHVSRFRDARTEPIRLFETEQVQSAASEIHQAHSTAGPDSFAKTEGKCSSQHFSLNSGLF